MRLLLVFILYLVSYTNLFATWFDNIPRIITQPDGEKIHCFVSGDQYAHRLHDQDNYTIIQNKEDGFFYYAIKDINKKLVVSEFIPGVHDPSLIGLEPGMNITLDEYNQNIDFYHNSTTERQSRDAPTSGEINQINIFIRFSDDPAFPNTRSYYDAAFQGDENEPSLQHYYWEVSYNSLWINTFHYPGTFNDINTAYQDEYPRSYYMPYSGANPGGYQDNDERTQREHSLLANALNSISDAVPDDLDIDADNDGYVDAVSFVIYGQPGDWADLLWPHRWALYTQNVTINGAAVWDYLFMLSESWYFNVGVLCHEFFHVLGAPDYYHYDGGGAPSPVGGWDIMESTNDPPQYPSAYTKWRYGDWITELPEITSGGTYTLNPGQQQDGGIYKIASPYSDTEYFVLEYRNQEGMYDSNAPGNRPGIIAYRINTEAGNGNAQGPPDEIYCYRPGGTLQNNGAFDNAPYNADYNHTQLNDTTDPSSFLYNNGAGAEGGLKLYNVTSAGETISFSISFGQPEVGVTPDQLSFIMEIDALQNQSITLANNGDLETVLNYQIQLSSGVPFDNVQGGPDGGGYFWSSSLVEPSMDYEWIDIEGIGTQIELVHNDQFASTPISLPFDFDYFGETYDYVDVNANGWIGWSDINENEWLNTSMPNTSAPRPAIFGFWDDLNPNNINGNQNSSGDIYFHANQERAVIWFNDVVRWNIDDSGQFDFQIVLYANGTFRTNYREMSGVVNSGTVGWQNADGTEGTQLSLNDNFISQNFSWFTSTIDEDIPWISLSSSVGDLSGIIAGGESIEFYVQVMTIDLEPGSYDASVAITSSELETVYIPISLTVTGENSTPVLPFIDILESENGIVDLPDNIDPLFSAIASRYTHILAPNGQAIPFLIQDNYEQNQIIHARNVLSSYLENIPETNWGNDKTTLINNIALSNAIIFLLNNEDEYENPNLLSLLDAGVKGRSLLATEVYPEGSEEYLLSSDIDVTYKKILNFVHVYGIQTAFPSMQIAIDAAMESAIQNNYYNPVSDLTEDQQIEEYFSLGLECYFGIWAHDPNGNGYCGENEYAFINREAMIDGDPELYYIINQFLGETWHYTASLLQNFENDFSMIYNVNLDYTHRSQYLKNAIADGLQPINIIGNNYVNHLTGNNSDNHFTGYESDDIYFGGQGIDRALYLGNLSEYIIIPPDMTEDSSFMVVDLVNNRDGTDYLFNIEEVEFNGVVYLLTDILNNDSENSLPAEFALYPPYPNPFNPTTTIRFSIESQHISKPYNDQASSLRIYDITGRMVDLLVDGEINPGHHEIQWNATNYASGIYFVELVAGKNRDIQKLILLK